MSDTQVGAYLNLIDTYQNQRDEISKSLRDAFFVLTQSKYTLGPREVMDNAQRNQDLIRVNIENNDINDILYQEYKLIMENMNDQKKFPQHYQILNVRISFQKVILLCVNLATTLSNLKSLENDIKKYTITK